MLVGVLWVERGEILSINSLRLRKIIDKGGCMITQRFFIYCLCPYKKSQVSEPESLVIIYHFLKLGYCDKNIDYNELVFHLISLEVV